MDTYDSYVDRKRHWLGVLLKRKLTRKLYGFVHDNLVVETPRVLEIGPGDGLIGSICRAENHHYHAIEENERIAAFLSSSDMKVDLHSIPPLPELDQQYDTCFLLNIIEHLHNYGDCEALIRDIYGVLDDNGKLVIVTPDYTVWKTHFFHCDATHRTPFTWPRLQRILVDNDFEISRQRTHYGLYSGKLLVWLMKLMNLILNKLLAVFSSPVKRDIWHRGLWTFLPCIFVVAKKKSL